MTKVEEIIVRNYDETKDFEILYYVLTHKKHFSDEMVEWAVEEQKKWRWLQGEPLDK